MVEVPAPSRQRAVNSINQQLLGKNIFHFLVVASACLLACPPWRAKDFGVSAERLSRAGPPVRVGPLCHVERICQSGSDETSLTIFLKNHATAYRPHLAVASASCARKLSVSQRTEIVAQTAGNALRLPSTRRCLYSAGTKCDAVVSVVVVARLMA